MAHRRPPLLLAPLFASLACGGPASTPTPSEAPPERHAEAKIPDPGPAQAQAGDGKAKRGKGSWGAAPAEARRDSVPEGIFERALAEGATAPDFTLEGSTGAFTLADALSKTTYVVLVFYRGAW